MKSVPMGYRLKSRDSVSSVNALGENGGAGYGTSPSLTHRSLLEETGVIVERKSSTASR